jgi:hypothetical protein
MHRAFAVVIPIAVAALLSVGAALPRATAQSGDATPSPVPTLVPTDDTQAFCPIANDLGTPTAAGAWKHADVRPPGSNVAVVMPAAELATPEPNPKRQLYLVTITLPVGGCMPYQAGGNQKDGAIVMIVQQGIVQLVWEPAFADTAPTITRGDMDAGGTPVPDANPQTLYPGDWVTLDQQVTFAYRNVSAEPAMILKAVWADPNEEKGSHGGHK